MRIHPGRGGAQRFYIGAKGCKRRDVAAGRTAAFGKCHRGPGVDAFNGHRILGDAEDVLVSEHAIHMMAPRDASPELALAAIDGDRDLSDARETSRTAANVSAACRRPGSY